MQCSGVPCHVLHVSLKDCEELRANVDTASISKRIDGRVKTSRLLIALDDLGVNLLTHYLVEARLQLLVSQIFVAKLWHLGELDHVVGWVLELFHLTPEPFEVEGQLVD